MIAWQRDGVGKGQESCPDRLRRRGMSEAVGTLYEFGSGLEPLTRLVLPSNRCCATGRRPRPGVGGLGGEAARPRRGLQSAGGELRLITDGSLSDGA